MVKVISLPYIFQVLYVLCFTRPRYQVSGYTTGPLVDHMELQLKSYSYCANPNTSLPLTIEKN